MNLRDLLLAVGVEPADLEHAIRRSRKLTQRAGAVARLGSKALDRVGENAELGSKRQFVALVGSGWLSQFAEETDKMLRPRGKR